jgi:O-antigen biosynthesis protein
VGGNALAITRERFSTWERQLNVKELKFTGEYFVPGKADARMEADHLERYRFACQYVAGKSVLDIACGAGYAAPMYVAADVASYLGVDISPELVESANEYYASENAAFVHGDITTFDCGRRFDVISCFETIEHVPNYKMAIQNLIQLLTPGGMLLMSSPNRHVTTPCAELLTDKPRNPFHVQEFLPAELLAELNAAGLTASMSDVYGQRLCRIPRNRVLRAAYKVFAGNPKKKASPEVKPLDGRTPRYFLIRATRAAEMKKSA